MKTKQIIKTSKSGKETNGETRSGWCLHTGSQWYASRRACRSGDCFAAALPRMHKGHTDLGSRLVPGVNPFMSTIVILILSLFQNPSCQPSLRPVAQKCICNTKHTISSRHIRAQQVFPKRVRGWPKMHTHSLKTGLCGPSTCSGLASFCLGQEAGITHHTDMSKVSPRRHENEPQLETWWCKDGQQNHFRPEWDYHKCYLEAGYKDCHTKPIRLGGPSRHLSGRP